MNELELNDALQHVDLSRNNNEERLECAHEPRFFDRTQLLHTDGTKNAEEDEADVPPDSVAVMDAPLMPRLAAQMYAVSRTAGCSATSQGIVQLAQRGGA